MHGATMKNCR